MENQSTDMEDSFGKLKIHNIRMKDTDKSGLSDNKWERKIKEISQNENWWSWRKKVENIK